MVKLKPVLSTTLEEIIQQEKFSTQENIPDLEDYCPGKRQGEVRLCDLHLILNYLSLHHFGVEPSISQHQLLGKACLLSGEYFYGNWTAHHRIDKSWLDKTVNNDDLLWMDPLSHSMIISLLARNVELFQKISRWPEDWMIPEGRAYPYPQGTEQVYFAIMNRYASRTLELDPERIEDKRTKLLFEAVACDQKNDKIVKLNQSLALFRKGLSKKGVDAYKAIAFEETIIVHALKCFESVDVISEIEPNLQPHILMLYGEMDTSSFLKP